jgi:hypothetical protein
MNTERLELLVRTYLDGEITADEVAELDAVLKTQPAARERFWQEMRMHAALRELGMAQGTRLEMAAEGAVGGWLASRMRQWRPFWRPLTAAAAGLIVGLFSASMVWAMTRFSETVIISLPLADASFESDDVVQQQGLPLKPGFWSGDWAEKSSAQGGITPKEGTHMLRMLRSYSEVDRTELTSSYGGDMMQWVDLRPFHSAMHAPGSLFELSASANMVAGQQAPFRLAVQMHAFTDLPDRWPQRINDLLESAQASSRAVVKLDGEAVTWQEATTRMLAPAGAEFLLVRITVTRTVPGAEGHVEFTGHFVDDLKLTLKTTHHSHP